MLIMIKFECIMIYRMGNMNPNEKPQRIQLERKTILKSELQNM